MPKPRKELICVAESPYIHVVSRVVRRAFLCGDQYEHRRGWVENKLLELAHIFCIDVAAYAVMSNHYHAVLYVDAEQAKSLTEKQVVQRWHKLFKGNLLSQKVDKGEVLLASEQIVFDEIIEKWRSRLTNVSWFMRMINEGIARQANHEDGCAGRFWEGRFKSQSLLDEKAVLACMAYVDLNPIRADMAKTPEKSHFTSIKKRCAKAEMTDKPNQKSQQPKELLSFVGNPRDKIPKGIQFTAVDYMLLVDSTGRQMRDGKRGFIDGKCQPILERLGLTEEQWLELTHEFGRSFKGFVGSELLVRKCCEVLNYKRPPGIRNCKWYFG